MWEWCIHVYNISPINMAMAGGWFMTLFYPHIGISTHSLLEGWLESDPDTLKLTRLFACALVTVMICQYR
jgi:hypothetical protein